MKVDDQFFEFNYDDEKIYFHIEQPTVEDIDYYDTYELNSPHDDLLLNTVRPRRHKQKLTLEDIPLPEWRRRLAMLPEI